MKLGGCIVSAMTMQWKQVAEKTVNRWQEEVKCYTTQGKLLHKFENALQYCYTI